MVTLRQQVFDTLLAYPELLELEPKQRITEIQHKLEPIPDTENRTIRKRISEYLIQFQNRDKKSILEPKKQALESESIPEPIKPHTNKKDSTQVKIEALESEIELLKSEFETIKSIINNYQQNVNNDYQQSNDNVNNLVTMINNVDIKGTDRDTFYITNQNRDRINSFYKDNKVNKSSLINFIINRFFESIE